MCLGKNIAIKDWNTIPNMTKKNSMRSTKTIQNKKECPLGDYVASGYAIYVGRGLYGGIMHPFVKHKDLVYKFQMVASYCIPFCK